MAITVSVLSGGGGHHGGHHGGGHGGGHRGGGGYYRSYSPSYYSNEIAIEPTNYYMTGVVDGNQVTWTAPVADYTGAYYPGGKKPTNIILLRAV
jgi:hypothetical protein